MSNVKLTKEQLETLIAKYNLSITVADVEKDGLLKTKNERQDKKEKMIELCKRLIKNDDVKLATFLAYVDKYFEIEEKLDKLFATDKFSVKSYIRDLDETRRKKKSKKQVSDNTQNSNLQSNSDNNSKYITIKKVK